MSYDERAGKLGMAWRRLIVLCFLSATIACNKSSQLSYQPRGYPRATDEGPHVSIVDRHMGLGEEDEEDTVQLHANLVSRDDEAVRDLHSLALEYFPSGEWVNFGPCSSFREIRIVFDGQEIVLRSWHSIYETDPNVVAASNGLTSLEGRTRGQFLASDDPAYLKKRNAFDLIESTLIDRYGVTAN